MLLTDETHAENANSYHRDPLQERVFGYRLSDGREFSKTREGTSVRGDSERQNSGRGTTVNDAATAS
jgi:hypothetical protein